mgnify:FL=1|jgi:putative FmdB family regulatory protein|tara:strand:- start:633 stop:914 length:282 start_codon:yes stop_codon:yes gene_type:complete
MPTYDYRCEKCGHTFEESLKIADREIPTEYPCEQQVHRAADICGGEVKQIIVAASGFAYDNIRTRHSTKKVPGWYSDKIKDLKNSKRFPNNNL